MWEDLPPRVQKVTNTLAFSPGCVWEDLESPSGTRIAQGMLWLELALTTGDAHRRFFMGNSYDCGQLQAETESREGILRRKCCQTYRFPASLLEG